MNCINTQFLQRTGPAVAPGVQSVCLNLAFRLRRKISEEKYNKKYWGVVAAALCEVG